MSQMVDTCVYYMLIPNLYLQICEAVRYLTRVRTFFSDLGSVGRNPIGFLADRYG